MIFDGHAYCFPSTAGDGGFSDPEDFRRHLQQAMAVHHQPVWRARDLAPGDASVLIDSDKWPSLDALNPSDFHAASNGRFEWTDDGERYFKQYFPPSIADMSYPPDRLVAEMDYAGVSRALLHRTPYLGIGNEFIADCVAQYPDRLLGLAHTPEWETHTDPVGSLANVRRAVEEGGLVGLQFLPPQLDLYNYDGPWDAPDFHQFWDGVADLGIPVFFSLKPRRPPAALSYAAELDTLTRWMDRYSDVPVVMTHGIEWRAFMTNDSVDLPDEVFAPFDPSQPVSTVLVSHCTRRSVGLSDDAGAAGDREVCQPDRGRQDHVGNGYADRHEILELPAEHRSYPNLQRPDFGG